ncbi:MAG: hypothetical protein M3319_16690 [Actinomycetota bacterium]|nr:hypothetical protein [Actinomycetota bacterium]
MQRAGGEGNHVSGALVVDRRSESEAVPEEPGHNYVDLMLEGRVAVVAPDGRIDAELCASSGLLRGDSARYVGLLAATVARQPG